MPYRLRLLTLTLLALLPSGCYLNRAALSRSGGQAGVVLHSRMATSGARTLRLSGLFYETAAGRTMLPASLDAEPQVPFDEIIKARVKMPDGRVVKLSAMPDGDDFNITLTAEPDKDVKRWGFAVAARSGEHFTGVMERLVDGPQTETWKADRKEGLDLRGQKVEFLLKPTLSVYAPFYLSSAGYGLFVRGSWPGLFDFCAADPGQVRVEFEGPKLDVKVYTSKSAAEVVQAHALEAGPPLVPPKWAFTPWRWRDEHSNLSEYFDGTPVIGPYNSQVMEDVLLMRHFGIPCGVYWIDRPWGPGPNGYDDFEIDAKRLPEFESMVKWLTRSELKLVLWIGPFVNGEMAKTAVERRYAYPTQKPQKNNYPLIDFTNPRAAAFWQGGVAKLMKLGAAGFKLDRAEEQMPDRGDEKVASGRTLTENRNAYPAQYVKAAYEIAHAKRGDDFVLMPRAASTGSAPYCIFWGGDISCTQWGLRASIVAVQRAAVMGYPCWGSDTCGYTGKMDREVCGRWLGFSCFTPVMEVGPTENRAFWDMPGEPHYDAELIAIWRFYARLHQRLIDYTYAYAKEAHATGTPIVRPLCVAYPGDAAAWEKWETYLYGDNILVAPVWKKGATQQEVYLPAGEKWQNAWIPSQVFSGGQSVAVETPLYLTPIFVRVGSGVDFGDLNKEYKLAMEAAARKPDMRRLDEVLRSQFDAEAAKRDGTAPEHR